MIKGELLLLVKAQKQWIAKEENKKETFKVWTTNSKKKKKKEII